MAAHRFERLGSGRLQLGTGVDRGASGARCARDGDCPATPVCYFKVISQVPTQTRRLRVRSTRGHFRAQKRSRTLDGEARKSLIIQHFIDVARPVSKSGFLTEVLVRFRPGAPSCFALARFAGFTSSKVAKQDALRSLGEGGLFLMHYVYLLYVQIQCPGNWLPILRSRIGEKPRRSSTTSSPVRVMPSQEKDSGDARRGLSRCRDPEKTSRLTSLQLRRGRDRSVAFVRKAFGQRCATHPAKLMVDNSAQRSFVPLCRPISWSPQDAYLANFTSALRRSSSAK